MKTVLPYGRWVLVTGCDSGFGLLTARQLLERGYGVLAVCLTDRGCRSLAESAPPGAPLRALRCDISQADDLGCLQAELDNLGEAQLWAVVNNAGIAIPGYIDFLDLQDFRQVMEVNFFGTVAVTRLCLPRLKRSRGRIINICSTCGLVALATNAPYNASKFALRAFTDTLRRELSVWGIRVALILPGVMRTAINDKFVATLNEKFRLAPEPVRTAYGEKFWQNVVENSSRLMDRMAGDPQQVVDAILHAVGSRRPKLQYLLGLDARMFQGLHRTAPRLADLLLDFSGKVKPAALAQAGTRRIEFSILCPADGETTWRNFIEELWLKGAGLTPALVVEQRGDETGKGATRWVPLFGGRGIREGITDTHYPEYLLYRVMDLPDSAFPVEFHRGRVDFLPDASSGTRLVWSVEYTPRRGAGWLVQLLVRAIIPKYLQALARGNPPPPGGGDDLSS